MRVVVLGGAGNFGARIVRALRGDPGIDLLVGGRRLVSVPGAEGVPGVVVDIRASDFAQRLCMAAILLARRLARGEVFKSGAFPCMGFVALSEFAPEFARWQITTRLEESLV